MMIPFMIHRILITLLILSSFAVNAAVYQGTPSSYRTLITGLQPGDVLHLSAGDYGNGLSLINMHGTAGQPIVITGPTTGAPAVFVGRTCCNTVQLENSSYLKISNLKLDGGNLPWVDGVNGRGNTHHITISNMILVGHGYDQQTVGISTKGPAWNWVIRNNTIIHSGTGMYLGDSSGNDPFVAGLIENNLIIDTIGYNIEIKHQNQRPTNIGMPSGLSKTIIRRNVFTKANQASTGNMSRPNLLVGHYPLSGVGANDSYEIYGNFFYQNPTEALFQGEGNVALYDNVFVNDFGPAVHIQAHNDKPRTINVFHNTIVSQGTGIKVSGVDTAYPQQVIANAIFAGTPLQLATHVSEQANIHDNYAAAATYLVSPVGAINASTLDLYPSAGKLRDIPIDMSSLSSFPDYNLDFNGDSRDGSYRGAYGGEVLNHGWQLQLAIMPVPGTALALPSAPSSLRLGVIR